MTDEPEMPQTAPDKGTVLRRSPCLGRIVPIALARSSPFRNFVRLAVTS